LPFSNNQKGKFAMITNQKTLRTLFWQTYPHLVRKGNARQNSYPADTRMAWCDFIEHLARSGTISATLASRATL
jgi:hypothetical protein